MTALLPLLLVAAAAVALLWGIGLLVARPLLPRRHLPLLPLVAPLLGCSLISAVAHYAGARGTPLRPLLWWFVGLAAAGWAVVLFDRRWRRFPRSTAPAMLVCLLAFSLAIGPLLVLGYLTTLGATIDGVMYAVRSEFLQGAPPVLPNVEAGKPYLGWVQAQIQILRLGDTYLVGLLGLLTGKRSYEMLTVVAALFFALTSGSVYLLGRVALGLGRRAALLAAVLVGTNNLLLWPVYDNFLSQSVALGFLPLVLAVGIDAQRRPQWRTLMLFAILMSGLASVYPLYAARALAAVLLFWGLAWLLLPRGPRLPALGRSAQWWLGTLLVLALWNYPGLIRAGGELGLLSGALQSGGAAKVGPGNILVFPPLVEVVGLIAHAGAAYGEDWKWLPLPLLNLVGLAVIGLAAYGWWRSKPRARLVIAALVVTSAALVSQQRWIAEYPYGYFKVLTTAVGEVMLLVAAGIAAVWAVRRRTQRGVDAKPAHRVAGGGKRTRERGRPRGQAARARPRSAGGSAAPPRWDATTLRRALAASAALALVGVNLRHSLWTQSYVLKSALVVDQELIDIGLAAKAVDPSEWILLDMKSSIRQNWLGYLLQAHKIRYREPLAMGHVDTPGAAYAFFHYAIVESELDQERRTSTLYEPWYDAVSFVRLGGNNRYQLRQRRDTVIASVRWDHSWPTSETLSVSMTPSADRLVTQLGERWLHSSTGGGNARTVQIRLHALGGSGSVTVAGFGAPVELEPGGWVFDLDLHCAAGKRIALAHAGDDVFLSEIRLLPNATGRPGRCLETTRLATGFASLRQQDLGEGRMRLEAALLQPENAGAHAYRLGLHIIDASQAQLFGVWSLDFPPGEGIRHGSLELDLRDRSSRGEIDGRPLPLAVGNFDRDSGSFEADLVLWQLHPVAQLRLEPVLWFQRDSLGTVKVTKSNRGDWFEVLSPP